VAGKREAGLMPIYEYECGGCGRTHEIIQKLSDEPLKECPSCGSKRIEKLISAAAIIVRESAPKVPNRLATSGSDRFAVDATMPLDSDFRHPWVGSLPAFGRDSGPLAIDATTTPDFRHPRIGFRRVKREGT